MSMIAGSRRAALICATLLPLRECENATSRGGFTRLHLARENGRSRVNPARFVAGRFCHYAGAPIHTIKPAIFDMGARTILKGYKTGEPHSSGVSR
ncbi:hypothetical protein EIB72_12860 [Burkholderia ambifaria]|uniref:hypothetical protein n=1 Tax=Burkholderia ambifaria TaxID=152480 RepID=UPI0013FD3642|nr:hypothetical protein [Burkholderia ambifaria]NHL67263.1 hypothetical protein [Burkholderia ambifaria]